MKKFTDPLRGWFSTRPRAAEWGWFVLLWLAGLAAVGAMAYPLKILIKSIG